MNQKQKCDEMEQFISDCKVERLEKLDLALEKDPEYASLSRTERELFHTLKELFPKEAYPYLLAYSDVHGDCRTFERSYYYKHGLHDGACLTETLLGGRKKIKLNITVV